MTSIAVLYNREEYITREADPNDAWDNNSTAATWSIHGIEVSDTYKDIDVDFDVVPGKNYYLLLADYGSGDSFGSYDNNLEFIDLFETEKAAEDAADELEEPPVDYSVSYTRNNGKKVMISCPWAGYFENLNGIYVEPVQLINKHHRHYRS